MRRRGLAIACALLILMLSSCTSTVQPVSRKRDDSLHNSINTEPYTLKRNEEETGKFDICDSTGKVVWSTGVDNDYYFGDGGLRVPIITERLKSLLNVTVCNSEGVTSVVNPLSDQVSIEVEETGTGFQVRYSSEKYAISILLLLEMENASFVVTVPADGIKETGAYKILNFDILPMFGAAKNQEDGYIFYPDGQGCLYRFDQHVDTGTPQNISVDVYGANSTQLENFQKDKAARIQNVHLPVFGIKSAEQAFAGFITDGAENCAISMKPASSSLRVNSVFCTVKVRKLQEYAVDTSVKVYSVQDTPDFDGVTVVYQFLTGAQADYSGMARLYREYLLRNERLPAAIEDPQASPLVLDVLMAVKEKSLLGDSRITVTSTQACEAILQDLQNEGLGHIQAILLGWQNNGYGLYPARITSCLSVGKNGLKNLLKYGREQEHALYLEQDYLYADEGEKGFSVYRDVVRDIFDAPISFDDRYMLKPSTALEMFSKDFSALYSLQAYGVCFTGISSELPTSYQKEDVINRSKAADCYYTILTNAAENSHIALDGGNAYLLSQADLIKRIPCRSSNYFVFDEDVPFYQMVVRGSLHYGYDVAFNLSDDMQTDWLRAVENGAFPYFIITDKNSSEMIDAEYNAVYSSAYGQWKPRLISMVKDYMDRLDCIKNAEMVKHERLSDTLVRIGYDNGVQVYVNYSDKDCLVEDFTVTARNFYVDGSGQNE